MKMLLAALLSGAAGFGGAMGYTHYVMSPPQVIVQTDPALHADLLALNAKVQASLDLNQTAWAQQQADRQQVQARAAQWRNDLGAFNRSVK